MSCRELLKAPLMCCCCGIDLTSQVEFNLHHKVAVAEAVSESVPAAPRPAPAAPAKPGTAVHVQAVCAKGHANLFYVELA